MNKNLEIAILRQLPYFVVVAEELNFQRASERLNIAQSALSRRMRDLEHALGEVPLFIRHARGVTLTAEGAALLEDARDILDRVEQARAHVLSAAAREAPRIAYSPGAVRNGLIADILRAFGNAFPDIGTEASLLPVEQILAGIRDGSYLAGLLYIDDVDPVFDVMDIAHEEFVLAVPQAHRLARAERIVAADLVDEDFIFYSRIHAPAVRRAIERELARRGVELRIAMESPTSEVTQRLVASGMGIGFTPATDRTLPYPGVVLRRVEDLSISARFRMLWLRASTSPALPRLIEAASAALAALDQSADGSRRSTDAGAITTR